MILSSNEVVKASQTALTSSGYLATLAQQGCAPDEAKKVTPAVCATRYINEVLIPIRGNWRVPIAPERLAGPRVGEGEQLIRYYVLGDRKMRIDVLYSVHDEIIWVFPEYE